MMKYKHGYINNEKKGIESVLKEFVPRTCEVRERKYFPPSPGIELLPYV